MHVYHSMPLEDFADQLRAVVAAQPFSPQRELTISMIDQIKAPSEEFEDGQVEGEARGRESMRLEMIGTFERDGLDPYIGLTETQHKQILELLGEVAP